MVLREYGRRLSRIWMAVYVIAGGAAFALLTLATGQWHSEMTRYDLVTLGILAVAVTLGWPMILARFGVYESQRRQRLAGQLRRLFLADALGTLVLSALSFILDAPVGPLLPLILGAVLFVFHLCLHLPAFYLLHALRRSGRNFRNILIIGAGPRARRTMEAIGEHPEWGYRVIGFIDDGATEFTPAVPVERVYKYADFPRIVRDRTVDEVLVACPRSMLSALAPIVNECALIGVPLTMLTDLFGDQLPPPRVGRFADMSTLSFAPVHHNELEMLAKRAIDVVGAAAGLLISAPVVAAAALVIRVTSSGPVFFRQIRSGMNGHPFEMLKLRTMVEDAEERKESVIHLNEMDGPVFKIEKDPRITPVGHILRKWSIDELPQFWNVLIGDMSIVGPRPPTPDEVAQYRGSDRRRLSMRPGLTCLWQISGRNEIGFEEWMKLDIQYIDSWSLANDLRIMARTVPEVLLARGAS